MNWDQMKKNVHARVQLKPTPHRLDDYGRKLPPVDDDWIVEEVSADGVRIKNLRTHAAPSMRLFLLPLSPPPWGSLQTKEAEHDDEDSQQERPRAVHR